MERARRVIRPELVTVDADRVGTHGPGVGVPLACSAGVTVAADASGPKIGHAFAVQPATRRLCGRTSAFLRHGSISQYADELRLLAKHRCRLSLNRANIRDSAGRWTLAGSKVVPFEQRFEQASPPSAGGVTALRPVSHRARLHCWERWEAPGKPVAGGDAALRGRTVPRTTRPTRVRALTRQGSHDDRDVRTSRR